MDLIKELGPSGSDNEDEDQEDGLIIIPPQCHTPDSSNSGKTVLPRSCASTSEPRDSIKTNLFRQTVKNKLKAYTEGRVSLPGSPIPSKKERKLTKEEDLIDQDRTSIDRDKKLYDNSLVVKVLSKDDAPVDAAIAANINTVGQIEVVSFKSIIDNQHIQDIELVTFSKKSVLRTSSIDRNEMKVGQIKTHPKSWSEIKDYETNLDTVRGHIQNSINTDQKATYDFRQQLLFKSPANLLNGLICKSAENKSAQRVSPQYLRYTTTEPRIVWSCNPVMNPSLTRSEILEYIPSDQRDSLSKLIATSESIKDIDKIVCNKWYAEIPLTCLTESTNNELQLVSFMTKTSNKEDCEFDLTPKSAEKQLLKLDKANISDKKIKKRKQKRSNSTTEDEDYSTKKASKKYKKAKLRKAKSKDSEFSYKSKRKDMKCLNLSEEYLKVQSENLKKKNEKYVEILPEEFEPPIGRHQDSKHKNRSKSCDSSEHKPKEKPSSCLKDHSKSLECKEQIEKLRKNYSRKYASKSHEDFHRKESSNSKAIETELEEESHTPKTEEYYSRWESDEELLKLERHVKNKYKHRKSTSRNLSWESEEENQSRQKYSSHHHYHRSAAERSLEMPLNIMNLSRHRSNTKCDNDDRYRPEQNLYSEDSWERGEYLKMKNELENIELQKGRHTLSEERRQLELEKQKLVEMEQRLAEQRYKHLQEQKIVIVDEDLHTNESKEKRYFENIGKEITGEENFVCDYHKAIIDFKQRKRRWEISKEDSNQSINMQTVDNPSSTPNPVSSSVFPFHKSSSIAIDVKNCSPKAEQYPPQVASVPIAVKENISSKELLEDVQQPTSTSSNVHPILSHDIEKVVELENEYEQFMMSLASTNDTLNEKMESKLEDFKVHLKDKKSSSCSSECTSESSSASSESSESTGTCSHEEDNKINNELPILVENCKENKIIESAASFEKEISSNKRMVTSTYANKPLIINQKPTLGIKPDESSKATAPIKILETIIIEDDDVPSIKLAELPDIDLSTIELPPQYTSPMEVPLNLIELPPIFKSEATCEYKPTIVEDKHFVAITEEIDLLPLRLPSNEEMSLITVPIESVEVSSVIEVPKEDLVLKRNNLISIKFLSPKKRALEMNSVISEEASDGEEEKKQNEDCTDSLKRVFSNLKEPPSSSRVITPIETTRHLDTRPQLISVEQKAKLDQLRKETLERNEKWELEKRSIEIQKAEKAAVVTTAEKTIVSKVEESFVQENEKLRVEKPIVKDMKDLREIIKDLKDTKEPTVRDFECADNHRYREQEKQKQRKESTHIDRKKSSESSTRDASNKRHPSKERETGQSRRRSVSPISSRRRRLSPPSRFDRGRDRDRDKERLRRLSPKRGIRDRDRRLDGKARRSRSRSPARSKSGDRRRSRDRSPKRRSGDRERDGRDIRRVSPSKSSRRRSPLPPSKRRSGHRDRSRSIDRKKERIEDTLKRLAGIDQYNSTSTSSQHYATTSATNPSSNKSPRSSPLDGFKRSLADSTISDDQLLPSITESPAKQSPKAEYYKLTSNYHNSNSATYHSKHDNSSSKPRSSPKRPSLDDRINQVLGIEKPDVEVEVPRRISTTYEGQYDCGSKYAYHHHQHVDYKSGYGSAIGGEMKAENGSRLVQMGNVLQIVPAASSGSGETSKSRKEHSSHHQCQSSSTHQSSHHQQSTSQQQILQVGNMLQIVPTALPAAQPTQSAPSVVSCAAVLAAVVAPPPPPPLPVEETVQQKILSSAEELLRKQHAQRKAEKEVRRHERDKRRKEKEQKQKERERKKALKLKTKTEDMIKRALMLEAEGNIEEEGSETTAVVEDTEDDVKWSPSNPVLAGALANLTKPVGKSILTSEKLSKLNVTKALELLTDSRKQVKFADGIIPGEGTSPSAGEELTSPPPSGKRALKEKRHTKSLLSKAVRNKLSKKKVKVKVVRSSKKHSIASFSSRNPTNPSSNPPNPNPSSQQPSPSPSDADLELLSSPSPPPGSPPPHIFPARVKPSPPPNNLHPTAATAFLAPAVQAHYPYTVSGTPVHPAAVGMMYGVASATIAPMVGVGGYVAPPPPPPPSAAVASSRYSGISTLPPTHQLPHHLALRAGASHKSRP